MDVLREAIVVEPEDTTLDRDFLPSSDMVIECCEGLVVWERECWIDEVRFSHSTVRDFVFNEGLLPLNYITRICLTYLSFEDFEAPLDDEHFRERVDKYKFAFFAASNWYIYIKGEGVEADEKVQIAFWRLVASRTKRESMMVMHQMMLTAGNETSLDIIAPFGLNYQSPLVKEAVWRTDLISKWPRVVWQTKREPVIVMHQMKPTAGNGTSLHLIARFGLNSLYQSLLVEEKGRAAYFKNRMPELERDKLAMLVEEIEDVSAKDLEGWTPLHHAADAGNKEVIVLLLSNGANIEAVDNKGRTALYYASDSLETIKFLVKHGANINAKDNDGRTALHSAAAGLGRTRETSKWLGADVNARDNDGSTALQSGATFDSRERVKWLVKHGADINARDDEGRTVLHLAVSFAGYDWEIVECLVEHGADINARDDKGRTVLHLAVSFAEHNDLDWEVVKWLVEHGADVDGEGTVLDYVNIKTNRFTALRFTEDFG